MTKATAGACCSGCDASCEADLTHQDLHTLSWAVRSSRTAARTDFWSAATVAHAVNSATELPSGGLRDMVSSIAQGVSQNSCESGSIWPWPEFEIAQTGIPTLDSLFGRVGQSKGGGGIPTLDALFDRIGETRDLDEEVGYDLRPWVPIPEPEIRDLDEELGYDLRPWVPIPEPPPPPPDDEPPVPPVEEDCSNLTCKLQVFVNDADIDSHPDAETIHAAKRRSMSLRKTAGAKSEYPIPAGHAGHGKLGSHPGVSLNKEQSKGFTHFPGGLAIAMNVTAFMALFTYSCNCRPTANIIWNKRKRGRRDFILDGSPSWMKSITVEGGSGGSGLSAKKIGGACWKAVVDTPSARAPKWSDYEFKVEGEVTWHGTSPPKKCKRKKYVRASGASVLEFTP